MTKVYLLLFKLIFLQFEKYFIVVQFLEHQTNETFVFAYFVPLKYVSRLTVKSCCIAKGYFLRLQSIL